MTTSDLKLKPAQYWVNWKDLPARHPYPKVTEYVLNHDEETGNETVIQTLEAGYKGEGAYGHEFQEEGFVISGTGYCATAKRWFKPGDYICRHPGMIHGPFHTKDDEDFTTLVINTRTAIGKPIPKDVPQFMHPLDQKKAEEKKANGVGDKE